MIRAQPTPSSATVFRYFFVIHEPKIDSFDADIVGQKHAHYDTFTFVCELEQRTCFALTVSSAVEGNHRKSDTDEERRRLRHGEVGSDLRKMS